MPQKRIIFIIIAILLFFPSTVIYSDTTPAVSPRQSEGDSAAPPKTDAAAPAEPKTDNSASPAPKTEVGPPPSQKTDTAPQPEASPLNFKLSPDGTVATILFDRESVEAMRGLLSQLEQNGNLGKVKGMVYSAAGYTPMLILLGDKEEILQKIELLKHFLPDQSQAHMVVIAASLRELSEDDALNIGLTVTPDIMGATVNSNAGLLFQSSNPAEYTLGASVGLADIPISNIVQLNEVLNRSKVLVSSEVYTRNGHKALLTNTQQVPIFSTDSNKNVMTSYQQLETSVDVVPTTIDYRKETPQESQVRVDVLVKISVITGTHSSGAASAPEYTTKTFATTRVLKANNERYVVGTFVNDGEYKGQYGIPLLSKIPILKYFFSREGNRRERNVAILTLAVRLIPMKTRDLTIDVKHENPLETLYKRKGFEKDAK